MDYIEIIQTKEIHAPDEYKTFDSPFRCGNKKDVIIGIHSRPKFLINWEDKKTKIKMMKYSTVTTLNLIDKKGKLVSNNLNDENEKLKLRVVKNYPKFLAFSVARTDTPMSYIKWFFAHSWTNFSKKFMYFYYYKLVAKNKMLQKIHKIDY